MSKIVGGDKVRKYDEPNSHGVVIKVDEPYCDVFWDHGIGRLEKDVWINDLQVIDPGLYERILNRLLKLFS